MPFGRGGRWGGGEGERGEGGRRKRREAGGLYLLQSIQKQLRHLSVTVQ